MMHVMVMVMMMVVVMVVMMPHRRLVVDRRGAGGSAGCCFLRDGVSGEAEREDRRGGKGLDHGKSVLWLANPNGSGQAIETPA
jgi:hypothetical protein